MSNDRFVYVTYIRTTPEKLWSALTAPEFTQKYWFGTRQESHWKAGSAWRLMTPDGRLADGGKIMEVVPQKRLVVSWRHELDSTMRAEGFSRATFELELQGEAVKLTVVHEIDRSGSELIKAVSTGWPMILSSLKSLLETGQSLAQTRHWPKGL